MKLSKVSRKFKLVFVLFCWASVAMAQVEPPEFTCVRNDSLFWNIPVVLCGPIQGYNIYRSDAIDGPYTLIDFVTDPAQDIYSHSNPGNLPYYFYLETVANCPGQNPISSDTLDNQLPPEIPINSVSVSGSDAVVEWTPVGDSDIVGYIIYRTTSFGTVPIDTVFGNLGSYIDQDVDAKTNIESYYVNSFDFCGQNSFFNDLHHTILPVVNVDRCTQTALITWNAYDGWPGGVGSYRIEVSENGGAFVTDGTVNGTINSYTLDELNKTINYQIRVIAVNDVDNYEAVSAGIEFQPDIVQTILGLNLFNADVREDGTISIEWTWDPTSEVSSVEVLYNAVGDDVIIVETVSIDPTNLNVLEQFTINTNGGVSQNPYEIALRVVDACGQEVLSNTQITIFLSGTILPSGASQLVWNRPLAEMRIIGQQALNSVDQNGSRTLLVSLLATQSSYQDFNPTILSSCFEIVAQGQVVLADGNIYNFTQHSNVSCVDKPVIAFVPNALAPKGTNSIFKPSLINAGNVRAYELAVYDRWGNRVFYSEHPEIGWDGTANGNYVATGVYLYDLHITTSSGNEQRTSGSINVLY
jgi:gliding motility-associated-like protein